MKLWMLVGMLALLSGTNALATPTAPAASIRVCGAIAQEQIDLSDAQKHALPKVQPPAPPATTTQAPQPPTNVQPPARVADACDVDAECARLREEARRRRRGSTEAIPDALLLGRRGAL